MFDEFVGDLQDDFFQAAKDYSIWTTREGKRIPIKDMTTSHLQNSIRYLKETGNGGSPYIAYMERELAGRDRRVITKHSFVITKDDLLKILAMRGIQLPKSGCGFYLSNDEGEQYFDNFELTARWDTDEAVSQTQESLIDGMNKLHAGLEERANIQQITKMTDKELYQEWLRLSIKLCSTGHNQEQHDAWYKRMTLIIAEQGRRTKDGKQNRVRRTNDKAKRRRRSTKGSTVHRNPNH